MSPFQQSLRPAASALALGSLEIFFGI